jgi:hypothetical protein
MRLKGFQVACTAVWLSVMAAGAVATDAASVPGTAPVVYVSDFDLDVADVKPDSGKIQQVRRLLPRGPLRSKQDPQTHAREIVSSMADTLTADLIKAGVAAQRLAPGGELPETGWRVRGVFLSVDDGNRLQRAIVGFGAGQSDLQVAVAFDDLSKPGQAPLYENVDKSESKPMPGAIIKLNPYVVAAKFVLDGRDEKTMIKNAAQQISDAVVDRMQGVPAK